MGNQFCEGGRSVTGLRVKLEFKGITESENS